MSVDAQRTPGVDQETRNTRADRQDRVAPARNNGEIRPLKPPSRPIECKRCGYCCEHVWLHYSPGYLKQRAQEGSPDFQRMNRMLEFNHKSPTGQYMYCCKHFARLKSGLGRCRVHKNKPMMCSDYPYYGKEQIRLDMVLPKRCSFWPESAAGRKAAKSAEKEKSKKSEKTVDTAANQA